MATIPLSELDSYLHRVSAAIDADVQVFVQDVAARVAYQLIYRTAVDVGTARSNWETSLGGPEIHTSPLRAVSPFKSRWRPRTLPYYSAGGFPNESANLRPTLSGMLSVFRARRIDQDIYIQNDLPYIERLAQGYSRQWSAGQMMAGVAIGVQQAVTEFKFTNLDRVS